MQNLRDLIQEEMKLSELYPSCDVMQFKDYFYVNTKTECVLYKNMQIIGKHKGQGFNGYVDNLSHLIIKDGTIYYCVIWNRPIEFQLVYPLCVNKDLYTSTNIIPHN